MRIALVTPLAVVAALAPLAGCVRRPALPDAAARLEQDTRGVLDAGAERLGGPGARPRVLLDTPRPCADGRARQVWRGTVPLRSGPDPEIMLDDATDAAIRLVRARGYRLEGAPGFARRVRTFVMTREDPEVRIAVRVSGGRRPALRLDATTPCLPRR